MVEKIGGRPNLDKLVKDIKEQMTAEENALMGHMEALRKMTRHDIIWTQRKSECGACRKMIFRGQLAFQNGRKRTHPECIKSWLKTETGGAKREMDTAHYCEREYSSDGHKYEEVTRNTVIQLKQLNDAIDLIKKQNYAKEGKGICEDTLRNKMTRLGENLRADRSAHTANVETFKRAEAALKAVEDLVASEKYLKLKEKANKLDILKNI
jgi:hypothetical protein